MKRTNKHARAFAKPVPQPAFKTPAQELEEFKAKVLAMKHGPIIWLDLDAYSVSEWTGKLRTTVGDKEFLTAYPEVLRESLELWPEYKRLLKRVPDALKDYKERYDQNRKLHKVGRDVRDLQGRGRPRTRDARDAQIWDLREKGMTYGEIARKLRIGREVAMSAYYRMKKQTRGTE